MGAVVADRDPPPIGADLTPSGISSHFRSRTSLLTTQPAPTSMWCLDTLCPVLLQIRISCRPRATPATATEPGDSKRLAPSTGQVWIGSTSQDRGWISPVGNLNIATPPSRLATIRVSSSMKSRPCGLLKAGDDSSTPPVNVTCGPAADVAMSMSKSATRCRMKAATARRRLLGEKQTSSVRPREAMTSFTLCGAANSIPNPLLFRSDTGIPSRDNRPLASVGNHRGSYSWVMTLRASVQRILGESPNKPPRRPVDSPEAPGRRGQLRDDAWVESRVLIVNRARPREPAPAAERSRTVTSTWMTQGKSSGTGAESVEPGDQRHSTEQTDEPSA